MLIILNPQNPVPLYKGDLLLLIHVDFVPLEKGEEEY